MAKRTVLIRTKGVRVALQRLLKQLDKLDDADRLALAARVTGSKKRTAEAWVEGIRNTLNGLEEWCPNRRGDNPFTIDVPPKRRRR